MSRIRLLSFVTVLAGCTPKYDAPFIAFSSDFYGFENWFTVDLGQQPSDEAHPPGHRIVYASHRTPKRGTWPVGSLIVKVVKSHDSDPPSDWLAFAMSMRGGDYPYVGGPGWEFLGLLLNDEGVPNIEWRGQAPPPEASANYAGGIGDPDACMNCHTETTDGVLTPQLIPQHPD